MRRTWIRSELLLALGLGLAVAPPAAGDTLHPSELTYLGAFKLPQVTTPEPAVWDWGGQAMTFFPDGDPGGGDDSFPGSLFATGLDTENWVSELSIPAPSLSRDLGTLPDATTLQPFADVRDGLFALFTELPRVGIEYLPPQGDQASEQLHLAWGQHFHDDPDLNIEPTHAWCDLDLELPHTQGAWWIGDQATADDGFIYSVNDYVFALPEAWAAAHVGGRTLASGRFRDGGWSGMGPSLVAYGPWLDGSPPGTAPPPETELSYRNLLLYSHTRGDDPTDHRLEGYSHADGWNGGAWLTAEGKSAVVFAGSKGSGYTWYGYYTPEGLPPPPLFGEGAPCPYLVGEIMCWQPDGVTPCTEEEIHGCDGADVDEESRGWWSSRFDAQLLYYDPADFAAVAAGTMEPWEPQPYALRDLDDHLFLNATQPDVTVYIGHGNQRHSRLGAPAYDRNRGLLYVLELFADDYRPLVHVFRLTTGAIFADGFESGDTSAWTTP